MIKILITILFTVFVNTAWAQIHGGTGVGTVGTFSFDKDSNAQRQISLPPVVLKSNYLFLKADEISEVTLQDGTVIKIEELRDFIRRKPLNGIIHKEEDWILE